MRHTLLFTAAMLFATLFTSCSSTKSSVNLDDLIVGDWVASYVNLDGEIVDAELFGGDIRFEFRKDGTAAYITPDGSHALGKYAVTKGKIIDPENPQEEPVDILELTEHALKIALIEEGKRMEMTFVRSDKLVITKVDGKLL